jgi:hypothetical protein
MLMQPLNVKPLIVSDLTLSGFAYNSMLGEAAKRKCNALKGSVVVGLRATASAFRSQVVWLVRQVPVDKGHVSISGLFSFRFGLVCGRENALLRRK